MTSSTAHPYARISDPTQRKGGGLWRQTLDPQTLAAVSRFCEMYGFALSKTVRVDDGVSAWKGLNATPEHELGKFLAEARRGLIRPGDCLLLENYDRLSRQDPWAAIGLVNDLRQLGIHVGRLDRMKLLRCDSTDTGDFFEAAIEFMRGNSESAMKSMRNGAAWSRKRKAAREAGAILTHRLPGWITHQDGRLQLIPERAAAVRRLFELAAGGYGQSLIVKKLTAEGASVIGRSRKWARGTVGMLLRDRRVLGEFQPRRRDRTPEGPPLLDYYPRVVSEALWVSARAGTTLRNDHPGRTGASGYINLFPGLLHDARGSGNYIMNDGSSRQRKVRRGLVTAASREGRSPAWSFPLDTFERAVLTRLREIDRSEIVGRAEGTNEVLRLGDQLGFVEGEIAKLKADLAKKHSPSLTEVLYQREEEARVLVAQRDEALQRVAHPLSESWSQMYTLWDGLESAPDPEGARLRLRAALRRIVEGIWLLVVPQGRTRRAVVQIWFAQDGVREYFITHVPPKNNGQRHQRGVVEVRSCRDLPLGADLRNPEQAERLRQTLDGEFEGDVSPIGQWVGRILNEGDVDRWEFD